MAIVTTVNFNEDAFIIHSDENSYDLQFEAVEVTVAGEAGDILESASAVVSSTSTEVLGILAEDTNGTGFVRVMVRGTPTTVDRQKLNYEDATVATVDGLLAEKQIAVINR